MMKSDTFTDAYPALLEIATQRARRLLRDAEEADEVAQETLLRAYVSWIDIADYGPQWVSRVATNLALTRLRKRRPLPIDTPSPKGDSTSEVKIDLDRALGRLPLRQRQVTLLRLVSDLPEREVAELLGISPGAVKRHLHRAIQRLRSPSIGLADAYAPAEQTEQEELMKSESNQWADRWRRAVEPKEGWPPFPWDHRYVADGEGSVDRVAVDPSGNVILDADGDEVMSGPGFDHQVVKVERNQPREEDPDKLAVPTEGLSPAVVEMLKRAFRWSEVLGHTWVGDDHFGLALLEASPEAVETIGADSSTLAQAIARFYEGPHAEARLRLVDERMGTNWAPPSVPNEVPAEVNNALATTLTKAIDQARSNDEELGPHHIAEELITHERPYSLVAWLLKAT